MAEQQYTTRSILIVLFAAVIGAGCFISIPLPGGVPITVQNMLAILAALTLGGADGFFAVMLFFLAGVIGLPVFSGGRGGLAHLMGPTGGFLIGYAVGALAAGLIAGKASAEAASRTGRGMLRLVCAAVAGFVVILICGVVRFMCMTGYDLGKTLMVCVVPFLPGDAIKTVVCVLIAPKLRLARVRLAV